MNADMEFATPAATKAPVSSHPAFPAIVALWFAALLGLGCLILPTALIEHLVAITGMASIIPAAAPPLGFTARAILALTAAVAGAAFGLILARKIAQTQTAQPNGRLLRGEAKCRPVSAHEELGETPLPPVQESSGEAPTTTQPVKERHSPAMTDNATLDLGEMAGQQETAMTDGKISPPTDTSAEHRGARAPERRASEQFDPVERVTGQDAECGDEDVGSLDALPFSAPSLKRKQPVLDLPADEDEDDGLDGEMPDVPMPRRAPVVEAEPQSAVPPAPKLSVVEPNDSAPADTVDAPADDRALEDLGLVQLAARLGASLERRRALQRAAKLQCAQTPSPAFAETTEGFDAAAADDAARARSEFFGGGEGSSEQQPSAANEPEPEAAPASEPAPRARFDFIDGEELANSYSLTRSSTQVGAWQQPTASYDDDGFEDEDGDEDEYSSLLALRNPFERKQPAFVRVEESESVDDGFETSVSFPQKQEAEPVEHAASPDPRHFDPPQDTPMQNAPHESGDTERELRAALESLQRTSNAG